MFLREHSFLILALSRKFSRKSLHYSLFVVSFALTIVQRGIAARRGTRQREQAAVGGGAVAGEAEANVDGSCRDFSGGIVTAAGGGRSRKHEMQES